MKRALNIALRTLHIAAMGVLLGGHAFDVAPERLHVSLWLVLGTGVAMTVVEAAPRWTWFHELRGVMTLVKVALMCAVLLVWEHRLILLLVVVVLGSVASHMPRRFRHYSLLHRRVISADPAPGGGRA
jgi:hypothetical protein